MLKGLKWNSPMWLEYREEEKEAKAEANDTQGPWVKQDCTG